MPNKALLLEYANYKIQISELEEKMALIKSAALAEVAAIKGDSDRPVELAELPGCSFSIKPGRRKWTYTPGTTAMEERLKKVQKEEQQTGDAVAEEGEPILFFNQPKE